MKLKRIFEILNKDIFIIFILIISTIVVHNKWFFDLSVKTYGDWGYISTEKGKEMLRLPEIITPVYLGITDLTLYFYPINLIMGFIFNLGFNFNIVEIIVFFLPIIILSILGPYLLIKYNTNSTLGSIFGTLFFSYSNYLTLLKTNQLLLATSICSACLVIYFYQKFIDNYKNLDLIYLILFTFIITIYDTRIFYIVFFILFFYTLFKIRDIISKKFLLKLTSSLVIYAISIILLNFYWIYPFLIQGNLVENEITKRGIFGNGFTNTYKSITLFHPFWNGEKFIDFQNQNLNPLYWSLPVLLILLIKNLKINRDTKNFIFFFFIYLLGILLSKQASIPFSGLYEWLYNNFIGFGLFRESTKFYSLLTIGASVCLGYTPVIFNNFSFYEKRITALLIIAIFYSYIFLSAKSIYTARIGTLFDSKEIPVEYTELNKILSEDSDIKRVLWVPVSSRWSSSTNNTEFLNSNEFTKGYLNKYELKNEALYRSEIVLDNEVLNNLSIKYIVIPLRDFKNDDDFFKHFNNRSYFTSLALQNSNISKIEHFNDLDVYINKDFKPIIRSESIKLTFKKLNAVTYIVETNEIRPGDEIILGTTFNNNWGLFVSEDSDQTLTRSEQNKIINSISSDKLYNLNKFIFTQESINKLNDFKKNGGFKFYIYFETQSRVNFGAMISLATLIIISITLLTICFIRIIKRKKTK